MREEGGLRFYAATDLVNYLGCAHATACDLRQLTNPVELSEDDEHAALLQEKGLEHERAYLERLRNEGRSVAEIPSNVALGARVTATRAAMQSGADVVYQGALVAAPWHGFSDFLLRVNAVPSSLGDFAYDVADTKLARTAKPKHIVQLCVYADLLGTTQGIEPPRMHVVLGDGTQVSLPTSTVRHYYGVARTRLEAFVAAPAATAAEPCNHCEFCRWKERCEAEWEANGHLSLVANINRTQIEKLRAGGVSTLRQLAALSEGSRIPNLQPDTLARLRAQARLQVARLDIGQNQHEVLPPLTGRGFARLPQPDPGDLFFDMEGDPLYELGLEYLFGLIHDDAGQERFTAYWAHNRADEKKAFENAVDFIMARLAAHPGAHIYHYASYEESALKRLAMLHGTREVDVDNLLRRHKLVDLYKVVREAVRISEPRYSIKNVEAFYLDSSRSGEVKTARESIIIYERFRRLGNVELLTQIEDYNKFDCQSLRWCRDWLISLRPAGLSWPTDLAPEKSDPAREQKWIEAEQRTAAHIRALTDGCPSEERPWRELLAYLLEFHRREAKPKYWAMFSRQEMSDEELVDDPECLGLLTADPARLPEAEKRSMIYSFTFPPQDFKMRVGEEVLRAGTLEPAGEIFSLEEDARCISVKLGPKWSRIADGASLIPKGPLGDEVLRAAIYRYAEAVIAGNTTRYTALTDIMRKAPPRLTGQRVGAPIIPSGADLLQGSVAALMRLDGSYMLVQGPPGAGKTYTSSHAIVALLKDKKRIGVASNSHKAINNLLKDVEAAAREQRVHFRGIKKSSNEGQYCRGSVICDTLDNDEATGGGHQLIAGTAWLFARQDLDQALDYLFIDEAGQVSLANVIAMGVIGAILWLDENLAGLFAAGMAQTRHPEYAALGEISVQGTPGIRGFGLDHGRAAEPTDWLHGEVQGHSGNSQGGRILAGRRHSWRHRQLRRHAADRKGGGVMAKKKGYRKTKQALTERSKIIEQSVIYLQSKAAFKAGFDADIGDNEFAGCGKGQHGARHFKAADKSLRKLVGLSPAHVSGTPPLTTEELKAKATVLRVMEREADTELTSDERIYVRFFAREVEDYLKNGAEG